VLCIAYLLFNEVYVKEYEKKCAAEHQKKLIEIQTAHSMKEIEEIKRSKYEISLIRHDMRHFLSNVSAMIGNNDYEKAQEYIKGIIQLTDQTVIRKYCENELVNMILSSYEKRMTDKSIRFDAAVAIPSKLPCSELEFTSILSNGLENAINAVSGLSEESRIIHVKLSIKNDKLLLSIQNAFATRPVFVNGLPVTNAIGHGLGTQSIQYVTAKLNGSCQFTADDRLFSLRVVL
jgi:ribosomal protein L22